MTTRVARLIWCSVLIGMFAIPALGQATANPPSAAESKLVALAAAQFPNLTRAERALLWFSDVENIDRGEIAVGGLSMNPADVGNDPAHADKWDTQRNVRAALIRWMCVAPEALKLLDPSGIRVIGARITGELNLSHVRVPAPLELRNCSIPEEISFASAEFPELNLNGSHTGGIYAEGIKVTGGLLMGDGFDGSAEVFMSGAMIDGLASFNGGRFHHSIAPRGVPPEWTAFDSNFKSALMLHDAQIRGSLSMSFGFEAEGAVNMDNASITGDLICFGGHFINPNRFAIWAPAAVVSHDVHLSDVIFQTASPQISVVNGVVEFANARIGGALDVAGVKFLGADSDLHGLDVQGASIKALLTQGASFSNAAVENLSDAEVGAIFDSETSWPASGKLNISGLRYQSFAQGLGIRSPVDVASRLKWLRLNIDLSDPQPYDQLAKYYRGVGDLNSAAQVLIARDDAIYSRSDRAHRVWGKFLKVTVGYGHRPLRTIMWMLAVVAVGWILVSTGARAGVMRRTWPENRPPSEQMNPYEDLSPLLFSLDVFLPFVNLHQEHYWWPDAEASGECRLLRWNIRVNGRLLRYYLWLQIIAGWLLSAIFIAGVTGLIRND